jgi:hypothetical protein
MVDWRTCIGAMLNSKTHAASWDKCWFVLLQLLYESWEQVGTEAVAGFE